MYLELKRLSTTHSITPHTIFLACYYEENIYFLCQWLATGRWFSPRTPISSTNKTDRQDITQLLLKVALNTMNPNPNIFLFFYQLTLIVIDVNPKLNMAKVIEQFYWMNLKTRLFEVNSVICNFCGNRNYKMVATTTPSVHIGPYRKWINICS